MSALAGHPKAIRIAGRRMSQSGNGPIKSPTNAKGPSPSTSPEDNIDDIHIRTPTDYPRPKVPSESDKDDEDSPQQEEDSHRRRKKEEQRKRGMSSEESRMRKMEASTGSARISQGRKMSNTGGIRITQPAGKMMQ